MDVHVGRWSFQMATNISNVIIEIIKYLCYNIQHLFMGHLRPFSIILLIVLSLEGKVCIY